MRSISSLVEHSTEVWFTSHCTIGMCTLHNILKFLMISGFKSVQLISLATAVVECSRVKYRYVEPWWSVVESSTGM